MQEELYPTIGLEIHAELRTTTKMFCSSPNDPDEMRPNTNICPVCLAHPGTLPVINREAVRHVLRVGLALEGRLADYTEFDRKNYFYPDLPKGYQLSQYEYPLVSGGMLDGVAITRVHLEEDTASSIHDETTGSTAVDFNRAGVPLMELVTEPVLTSSRQAGSFARELQLLLRALGASSANMEKGEMRVEANVSVRTASQQKSGEFGTKVEIKNLNSFRAMERAVEYEIKRQSKLIRAGKQVVQQTLGWDEARQATFPQRAKEGSADYRYFPDPDLPSLKLSEIREFSTADLLQDMPELPAERRARYVALGLKPEDADSFVRNTRLGGFFEDVIGTSNDGKVSALAANYIANDLVKIIRDNDGRDTENDSEIPISAHSFRKIIDMSLQNAITSRAAKDLLMLCVTEKGDPEELAAKNGMLRSGVDADAVNVTIVKVLAAHASVVKDYRAGKGSAIEFLLGQCMRELRGAADPGELRRHLLDKLNG